MACFCFSKNLYMDTINNDNSYIIGFFATYKIFPKQPQGIFPSTFLEQNLNLNWVNKLNLSFLLHKEIIKQNLWIFWFFLFKTTRSSLEYCTFNLTRCNLVIYVHEFSSSSYHYILCHVCFLLESRVLVVNFLKSIFSFTE